MNQISPSDDEGAAEVVLSDALRLLVAVGGGLADAAQARERDVVVGRRALPRVLAWKKMEKVACREFGRLEKTDTKRTITDLKREDDICWADDFKSGSYKPKIMLYSQINLSYR